MHLLMWLKQFCVVLADGTEKPIAYSSCILNAVERKYHELDKEAMATEFGVKTFSSIS